LALHEIPLERSTLHGHFSRDLEPVLEIDSGDSVRISTPNAGWYLASGELFEPRDEELDAGHALAGPIAVRGADAGGTLAVRIDEVVPGPWGVTLTSPPHLIRWELADGVGRGAGMGVELRPFLGVLGMPPPEQGIHSTGPPRRWGGNIDCADLLAGSTLYLPIPVDGALFSAGDGHARQGDGEICGTAIECPSEATVTLTLVDGLPSSGRSRARPRHGSHSGSETTSTPRRGSPLTESWRSSRVSTGSGRRTRWPWQVSSPTCA
jgi:acetamidase/formamidase